MKPNRAALEIVRRPTALELLMDFGIDSVVVEPGMTKPPFFATHRAKTTNTVPGIAHVLAGASQRSDSDSIRKKPAPNHVDELQPEHPAKFVNLPRLIGRDARCSLFVCAVRGPFRLVSYRSFDLDCFIGIHDILLTPLGKAIPTPNLELALRIVPR